MASPEPTLLVFDLDGTLYDTASSYVPTMERLYAEYGLPVPSPSTILETVGEPFDVILDDLVAKGFPPDRAALACRLTDLESESIAQRGALFPGVRKTLVVLREAGCRIALCTNGDRRYADAVLSTCGILDLFDALQTNDVEGVTKTELLGELLARIPHGLAFMIGDRYHDMEAGRANGCMVIGGAYGYECDELAVADRRILTFAELPGVVRGYSQDA